MSVNDLDRRMLDRAAALAIRSAGRVEPNPLVGCVIGASDGRVLGMGHHQKFGQAHAEVEALRDCARKAANPRGATAWVTLEPCNHTGKTGPCAEALISAGIARVVYAVADPNPIATGGAERLRAAGVEALHAPISKNACRLLDPFARRMATGLPWIIAKWAQTIDGAVATRTGASKWISGATSRRHVHRLRARVDAVLTGIGTVIADDPQLTARDVPLRRVARRVVIDPQLRIPMNSALVKSAERTSLIIVTTQSALATSSAHAAALDDAGAEVVGFEAADNRLDLVQVLRWIVAEHTVSNVLVEAGPGLMGCLFRDDLVDEARVYIAPMMLGDPEALRAANMGAAPNLSRAARMELIRSRQIGADALLCYRRPADRITCPPAPRPAS